MPRKSSGVSRSELTLRAFLNLPGETGASQRTVLAPPPSISNTLSSKSTSIPSTASRTPRASFFARTVTACDIPGPDSTDTVRPGSGRATCLGSAK